jgi:hypothetical protein
MVEVLGQGSDGVCLSTREITNCQWQPDSKPQTFGVSRIPLPSVGSDDEYSDPTESEDDSTDCNESDEEYLDIDIRHMGEPAKLAKYAERIFVLAQEEIPETSLSSSTLLSVQTAIRPEDREVAIGLIFRIQDMFAMSNDTLYQAVTYLNIALSGRTFTHHELQLAAFTAIWMASKVEESAAPPKLDRLSRLSDNHFSPDDFLNCERDLLTLLDFRLTFPTTKLFLRRLLDSIDASSDVREVAAFFSDLSLIPVEMLDYPPDITALSAACLGKLTLGEYCPTRRLMAYGHIDNPETIQMCSEALLVCAAETMGHPNSIIYKRYTQAPKEGQILRMKLDKDLIAQL